MSTQDTIADMLTNIRNGQSARKDTISLPFSKIKERISFLLKEEGFIKDFKIKENNKKLIEINLKYFNNKPVIEYIMRVSKPGLRIYKKSHMIPKIMGGMGVAIISTSKGIITDRLARKLNIGGEIMFYVF